MTEYIIGIEGTLHEDYIELAPKISGEIVRCRDCEYQSDDGLTALWCSENYREVRPDGFCVWAERREP